MKHISIAATAALLLVGALPALGQGKAHLEIRTIVQKEEVVIADDGTRETRIVDAELVVPGDEVIYTVSFANVSEESAENIVITNPLPEQLSYVDGSAMAPGANVEFSVDGGQTYGAGGELTVVENGIERPARSEDITHIRWVVETSIEPGEEGIAQFRARLN